MEKMNWEKAVEEGCARIGWEDVGKLEIWEMAKVEDIPQGWFLYVVYNFETKELYRTGLATGQTEFIWGKHEIPLYKFVSLDEWYTNYPESLLEEGEEEPSTETLLDVYQEEFWEDFEWPTKEEIREAQEG